MLRVLIVDDEPAARRGVELLLREHADVKIVGQAGTVLEAESLLQEQRPDVVFLDIEMPHARGFKLIESLEEKTQVIFITAHDEYAARAFEVNALDYLMKPVRAARFNESLDRARKFFREKSPVPTLALVLREGDERKEMLVAVEDILALQAQGDYTRFLVSGVAGFLVLQSLGHYENDLGAAQFCRVNRSLIVNLARVRTIETVSRDSGLLHLKGLSEPLELRRTSLKTLRKAIGEFKGS